MKRPYIVGNWKMNLGLPEEAASFVRKLVGLLQGDSSADVAIIPPFLSLHAAVQAARGTALNVGAQNVSWAKSGAFTGETAPLMLKAAGAAFALIGHSERRSLFGEHDQVVARKARTSRDHGLAVMICVGESLGERDAGKTDPVITRQLQAVLDVLTPADAPALTLAYEPVWAIGTGRTATVEQAAQAHATLRKVLASHWGEPLANATPILYGGSVNPENARDLLTADGVDGALVGGASLKPESFAAIIAASSAAAPETD